ncbi:MAG: hypothetical protein J07HQX50_02511, partial [Haloquadratum sp. J07HQX50]
HQARDALLANTVVEAEDSIRKHGSR